MFTGGEEFEGAIDINKILNDASLHDELRSLGWVDHDAPAARPPPKKAPKPRAGEQTAAPTQQVSAMIDPESIVPVDIGGLGLVDDDNVQLTDADMEDEGLLAEFAHISGQAHSEGVSELNNNDAHDEEDDQEDEDEPEQTTNHRWPSQDAALVRQASNTKTAAPTIPGIPTVEEAKHTAVKFKREGNTTEALKWLRYAKQLESGSFTEPPMLPATATMHANSATVSVTTRTNTTAGARAAASTGKPGAVSGRPPPASGTKGTTTATVRQAPPSTGIAQPATAYQSTTTTMSTSIGLNGDPFEPLESAIMEASTSALREAKYAEKTDTKVAVAKMREYKALQQELVVLRSRRNTPGASPALFHWQTVRKETVVENTDIAEDEVKLIVEGLYDIAGIVEGHTSRSISVSYLLGILKEEDAKPAVVPAATYSDGRVVYHYETLLPILKRGRHVQQLYARKKATFDLVLHRGFWKGPEVLCQAVLPLSELLTKSTIGGNLQLKTVSDSGSSKKGKVLGGHLTVYVKVRSPLSGPEVHVTEERKLVIEPWPPVLTPLVQTAPAPTPPMAGTPTPPTAGALVSAALMPPTPTPSTGGHDTELPDSSTASTPVPVLTGPLATLTDKERADPHSVDFIESNDVLEAEIATAEALARSSQDEDEQFNAQLRVQLLNTKLQLLVYQVQNDQLSLEDYLDRVRARIKRDQLIALYLKTLGDKENVGTALAVMKRVQIMKKEVQNAEKASAEGESEGEGEG